MSRGMVKWNAFNALVDQGERLARLRVDRQRQPKPVLSQQQKEELDALLQEAWSTQTPVCITYYHEGFFQDIHGLITSVQPTERTISINKKQHHVREIVAMNLLKED